MCNLSGQELGSNQSNIPQNDGDNWIQAIVGFPHCKWDKKGLMKTTVVRAELEWFHMVSPEIRVCPKRLQALVTQQPIKPKVCIVNPGYYPPEMMVSY